MDCHFVALGSHFDIAIGKIAHITRDHMTRREFNSRTSKTNPLNAALKKKIEADVGHCGVSDGAAGRQR